MQGRLARVHQGSSPTRQPKDELGVASAACYVAREIDQLPDHLPSSSKKAPGQHVIVTMRKPREDAIVESRLPRIFGRRKSGAA